MSLFLGSDTSNNKIMHITKGHTSLLDIKGPPIATTVFHSDLNYINVKHTYSSLIYKYDIPEWNSESDPTWFTVDQYTKDLMNSYMWFIISSSGEVVKSSLEVTTWASEPTPGVSQRTSGWLNGGLTYQIVRLVYNSGVRGNFLSVGIDPKYYGNCTVCITNVTNQGVVEKPPVYESDILIKTNLIKIKGTDFLNFRFLSPGITNGYDLVGTTSSGTFQILNSTYTSGELSFISNQNETSVYKGSKPIISTALSRNMEIQYSGIFNPTISGLTNNVYTAPALYFPSAIPSSSVVFISWTTSWGRSMCFVASPNGESNYLIGANLVYRPYITGDSDLLRVKIIIYSTYIALEFYYYKRVYVGGKGYYPSDSYSIQLNMSYLVIGN